MMFSVYKEFAENQHFQNMQNEDQNFQNNMPDLMWKYLCTCNNCILRNYNK